jgi:hypothetical protein
LHAFNVVPTNAREEKISLCVHVSQTLVRFCVALLVWGLSAPVRLAGVMREERDASRS